MMRRLADWFHDRYGTPHYVSAEDAKLQVMLEIWHIEHCHGNMPGWPEQSPDYHDGAIDALRRVAGVLNLQLPCPSDVKDTSDYD